MNHVTEKEISAYIDGQLSRSDSQLIEQHLLVCPDCSESCREMRQITKLFQSAENLAPSPYLWSKIMRQADNLPEKKTWRFNYIFSVRKPIWVAAAVLLVLGAFVSQHRIQMLFWQHELKGIEDIRVTLNKKNSQENNPFTIALTGDRSSKPFSTEKADLQSNPFSAMWR